MRIETPRYTERFGCLRLHEVLKVLELDSGIQNNHSSALAVKRIPEDKMIQSLSNTAVVVPIRNEPLNTFEGVLSGIPNNCKIIVVSNSDRTPADRYHLERDILDQYCYFTQRNAIIIHQRDKKLADLLAGIGYTDILDDSGLLTNGKAEGMIAGVLIAHAIGAGSVGFIDADNYFPGSVWEYCRIFAAGSVLSQTPYYMTRIQWKYKPKPVGEEQMIFKKFGRVSERTNSYLNKLVAINTRFETDIIRTGNAGEHAISMPLALQMRFASGFAIEAFEFVELFERFGASLQVDIPSNICEYGIELFQVESRNPHMHEPKGAEHINDMTLSSAGIIVHSPLCSETLRQEILSELQKDSILSNDIMAKATVYPALDNYATRFAECSTEYIQRHTVPTGKTWQSL